MFGFGVSFVFLADYIQSFQIVCAKAGFEWGIGQYFERWVDEPIV